MLDKIKEFAKEVDISKANVINKYIKSLQDENRILSYWDNGFKDNPKKYIDDINVNRYVSYNARTHNHICKKCSRIHVHGGTCSFMFTYRFANLWKRGRSFKK